MPNARAAATWFLILAAGCTPSSERAPAHSPIHALLQREAAYQAAWSVAPLRVTGRILDEAGRGVHGASISLAGFGPLTAPPCSAHSDPDGRFALTGCARKSWLLRVHRDDFYPEVIAIDLQAPLEVDHLGLPPIALTQRRAGRVRLMFGGDVMMGRRFVQREGHAPKGERDGPIHPATEARDMDRVLLFLRESLSAADVTVVNLETPVTGSPPALHGAKSYAFWSGPSLPGALARAGVDAVSIGNNHLYDALDPGVRETLAHLRAAGLFYFGGGTSESDAAASAWHPTVGGVDLALQGFTSIVAPSRPPPSGSTWPPDLLYVARDQPIAKGGALELTPAHLNGFLEGARGRFAVPVLHGGVEYGYRPDPALRGSIVNALQAGAALVVVHHSHTAQGLAWTRARGRLGWAITSLGNLVFDQDVFDTFRGYTAVVDVDQTTTSAQEIRRIRIVPHHLEDYVPKLLAGAGAARESRRIAFLSNAIGTNTSDGLHGASVTFDGLVALAVGATGGVLFRDVARALDTPSRGGDTGPIAYDRIDATDSLARVIAPGARQCHLGRDLLVYGDFEDGDVDDGSGETPYWGEGAGQATVHADAYAGNGALALLRKARGGGSSASFRARVPFPLGRALTVRAVARGDHAGDLRLRLRWHRGRSARVEATEVKLLRRAGTYGWEAVFLDLLPPGGSGALGLAIEQAPGDGRDGVAWLDEVALITWESCPGEASGEVALQTPNGWDFLRLRAAPGGTGATLVHRLGAGGGGDAPVSGADAEGARQGLYPGGGGAIPGLHVSRQ